jgi:hypothetical protein
MKMTRRIRLAAGVLAALVLLAVVLLAFGGREYEEEELGPESPQVRQAMALLGELTAEPEAVERHLTAEADGRVAKMVQAAARALGEGAPLECVDAARFGDYLRLGVRCAGDGDQSPVRYFFLQQEAGELRIRGLQL